MQYWQKLDILKVYVCFTIINVDVKKMNVLICVSKELFMMDLISSFFAIAITYLVVFNEFVNFDVLVTLF